MTDTLRAKIAEALAVEAKQSGLQLSESQTIFLAAAVLPVLVSVFDPSCSKLDEALGDESGDAIWKAEDANLQLIEILNEAKRGAR